MGYPHRSPASLSHLPHRFTVALRTNVSVEKLAARHDAVPYNHIDQHGNVWVHHWGADRVCGRIVHNGTLFFRRDAGRIFLPRSDADLARLDMLVRMGRALRASEPCPEDQMARRVAHLAEILDALDGLDAAQAVCQTMNHSNTSGLVPDSQ